MTGAASSGAGLSGLALYLPPYRVRLNDWCGWTGNDPAHIAGVVGEAFRMPGPDENVYTMAAEAVMRLIRAGRVDPARVGQLILATESSSDNAVGAVIVRGLVDDALRAAGRPALASDCEVPEIKQACLAGVYALKQAVRYLRCDGAGRQAIVVCADIAEYARGSSGEATQGAGAVAMLLEAEAALLALDIGAGGSASRYRIADFRKPMARFCGQQPAPDNDRLRDFPVFNGKYSTACYTDTMLRAFGAWHARGDGAWTGQLAGPAAIFMHRPYRQMPERALAQVVLQALLHDAGAEDGVVRACCAAAGIDAQALHAETRAAAELRIVPDGPLPEQARPLLAQAARAFRKQPEYAALVAERLGPGERAMRHAGNLYTASLPAWLAAGLAEAAAQGHAWDGRDLLLAGYGSGDAAEVLPARLVPDWQAAAGCIDLSALEAAAVDLDARQYAALHDGSGAAAVAGTPSRPGVRIAGVGARGEGAFCDAGIAWYALHGR